MVLFPVKLLPGAKAMPMLVPPLPLPPMRERDGNRATVARFDASRLGLARMRSVASEAPPETDWARVRFAGPLSSCHGPAGRRLLLRPIAATKMRPQER
jgi:hypothetical protein